MIDSPDACTPIFKITASDAGLPLMICDQANSFAKALMRLSICKISSCSFSLSTLSRADGSPMKMWLKDRVSLRLERLFPKGETLVRASPMFARVAGSHGQGFFVTPLAVLGEANPCPYYGYGRCCCPAPTVACCC